MASLLSEAQSLSLTLALESSASPDNRAELHELISLFLFELEQTCTAPRLAEEISMLGEQEAMCVATTVFRALNKTGMNLNEEGLKEMEEKIQKRKFIHNKSTKSQKNHQINPSDRSSVHAEAEAEATTAQTEKNVQDEQVKKRLRRETHETPVMEKKEPKQVQNTTGTEAEKCAPKSMRSNNQHDQKQNVVRGRDGKVYTLLPYGSKSSNIAVNNSTSDGHQKKETSTQETRYDVANAAKNRPETSSPAIRSINTQYEGKTRDISSEKTVKPAKPAADGTKAKTKCIYFPNCKNPNCSFFHPTKACKLFPNCPYGISACLYIHPVIPCKYGVNCTNKVCNFSHGKSSTATSVNASRSLKSHRPIDVPCKLGASCSNSRCPFEHGDTLTSKSFSGVGNQDVSSQVCRYDIKCNLISCAFLHPQRDARDAKFLSKNE